MIFKNRMLFSYGFHNNLNIASSEIDKSLGLTDWSDEQNKSLYFSHSERDAQKWIGRIQNPRILNGALFGDLEIHDADLAMKLGPGKAPLGVSAEIRWPQQYTDPVNFSYKGFAMVPNPEVPATMVNQPNHNQAGFSSAKIVTPFSDNSAAFAEDPAINKVMEEMKQDGSEEGNEEESDLMSAERGFKENKMEEKNANDVAPEVKEETVETVEAVKAPVEEVKEEVKEDESVEEESNEAEFSALKDKFEALFARVTTLEENQAKFSETVEAKAEVVEEEKVEEEVEEAKEEVKEEESEAEFAEEETEKSEESEEEEVEEEAEEKVEEVEESNEEDAEAKFSKLAEKVGELVEVISKKEAAPMSTAEFGARGADNETAVIDRLTKSLSN
ncbi:MAG: hypothetical protein ACTSQH_00030 [Candidatus Hodarchaeales archaeon]